MPVRRIVLAAFLAVLVACQSGGTETTVDATTAPPATTAATEETSDPGTVSSFGDIPAECLDAFRAYLGELEPFVADMDFDSATMADFEALGEELAEINESFEAQTASCPELDLSTEESLAAMREFAEQEAPGTAGYFAFIEEMVTSTGGAAASGDCEADLAAIQEFVDSGGTIADLTLADVTAFGNLMASVSTECSADRLQEFLSQDDVAAFMEASG